MLTTMKPVLETTAGELMSDHVLCLPQDTSMHEAARLLIQNRISGAPVVDASGKCVGVISSTDFVFLADYADSKYKEAHSCPHQPCVCTDWEVVAVENLPPDMVCRYMTADPVMVSPDTPIADLAREMIDAHIHRIVVVDEQHKPMGIVTTTDLLAALAKAKEGPEG